ncbi:LysR family transcriptional regulator [Meridianimarinicoccus aquatilis]|uniref:LysR family transcriptional regulator n=1 Tax=Meridianimarinicoccus aquatilis TaxID=2552766 RepID=A0A4R6ASI9_9RHOB|nr:LysR family transcriptional regulator [Fluviibacterium aquatile]TDL86947.1 LysR family transcriptional regulator [Fluviibacterium aquatile]
MDLNTLKEFSAIATEGSFAAAARKLGMPKSTMSKRIQDLEAALGVRLIERTTRRLNLTAEGALVLARAERILADAGEITRALSEPDGAVRGHLRIAAPLLFGQAYLGQIVAASRRLYPDLTLEIVLTDSQPDLIEEGFDAAIRVSHPADSPFVSQTIARSHRVTVAAPELCDLVIDDPADLAGLPILLYGIGLVQTWHFQQGKLDKSVRLAGGLAMTSYFALRDAAIGGAGVAQMPLFLVERDIAEGRLMQLLPNWACPAAELSFVYPSPQALTARLRAFRDLLVQAFPDGTLHGGVLRPGG